MSAQIEKAASQAKVQNLILPVGWGTDRLSDFIRTAHENTYATYAHKNGWFRRLLDIDSSYEALISNFSSKKEDFTFALLVMRSHASFRASCQMAMSGQVPECFMLLRGALESALYGLHLKINPKDQEVWFNRTNTSETRANSRKVFSYGNVKNTFRATGSKHIATSESLYEELLDFGGHPNEGAVTANAVIKDNGNNTTNLELNYIADDSVQLEYAFVSTARVGAVCLYIIKEGNPIEFTMLGLEDLLNKITDGI